MFTLLNHRTVDTYDTKMIHIKATRGVKRGTSTFWDYKSYIFSLSNSTPRRFPYYLLLNLLLYLFFIFYLTRCTLPDFLSVSSCVVGCSKSSISLFEPIFWCNLFLFNQKCEFCIVRMVINVSMFQSVHRPHCFHLSVNRWIFLVSHWHVKGPGVWNRALGFFCRRTVRRKDSSP